MSAHQLHHQCLPWRIHPHSVSHWHAFLLSHCEVNNITVFAVCKRHWAARLKTSRICLLHHVSLFCIPFFFNNCGRLFFHACVCCLIRLPWSLSLPLSLLFIITVLWILISISLFPALTITLPMWWLMGSRWTWACGIQQGRRTTTGCGLCPTHRQ